MAPTVEDVDLVVIGSGPAGEKAAAHAAYFGRRVVVVERSELVGGAPIGTAGVPTKTLRETALYLTGFRRADVHGVGMHLDARRITKLTQRRNEEVQSTMVARVRENLARNHIELVHGTARLGPARTVLVRDGRGGPDRVLRGEAVCSSPPARRPYIRRTSRRTRTSSTPTASSPRCTPSPGWWSSDRGRSAVSTPRSARRWGRT